MAKKGKMTRTASGKFVKGQSGNPKGRPVGSKNKVNALKLVVEETFRAEADEKVNKVLHMVLDQALLGDKPSQKMVWDANVSKANISEDKMGGAKQQITINRMDVKSGGDIIDVTPEEEDEQSKQTESAGSVQTH